MKPSWDYAPEWAQWLGQDHCRHWYWYECEPRECEEGYRRNHGRTEFAGESESVSLERRP